MVSKWSPYVCKRCKTNSDFPLKQNIILGVDIGLLFGILGYLLSKVIGGFSIIGTFLLVIILIPLIQYYFFKSGNIEYI